MVKKLPDTYVRKAIYEAINNMTVFDVLGNENIQIPCFDTRVPPENDKSHYILLKTQTNTVDKATKCEDSWESSILLDIITTYEGAGNTGSRVLADNILDKARELTHELSLDVSSGLVIVNQTQNFPDDIATITDTENVFRKFMRIEMYIN